MSAFSHHPTLRRWVQLASLPLVLSLLGVLIQPSHAQGIATDAAQSSFPFRRSVEVRGSSMDGFAVFALPPELSNGDAEGGYRLIRSDGREVPYVVTSDAGESKDRRHSGQLVDTRHEGDQTLWIVDLGSIRRFESLDLNIPQIQFRRRVTVEAAEQQNGPYHVIARDVGIFDLPWQNAPGGRLHYTTVRFAESQRARFLRFQISSRWRGFLFRPLSLQGVAAVAHLNRPGSEWTLPAPLVPMATPPSPKHVKPGDHPHLSLYRIDVPPGLSFRHIQLSARDPGFVRSVRLLEIEDNASTVHSSTGKLHVLSEGMIFRISDGPVPTSGGKKADKGEKTDPIDDEPVTGENLTIPVEDRPGKGILVLEITDGDSPALTDLTATVSGIGSRLIFPVGPSASRESDSAQKYALYFGSETATKRDYDLQKLVSSLSRLGSFLPAQLGGKEPNPRFQKAQPLPAVPTAGSPIVTSSYRLMRTVAMRDGVELYSIQLSPVDIAYLKPDFGDLRVVDPDGQQVPYVLIPNAIETRTELEFAKEPAGDGKMSRYRLSLRHGNQLLQVPIDALELSVGSSFYRRTVRIREVRSEATPYASQLLSATILRLSEDDAGFHRLPLPGQPVRELLLEIDNGDNPPLDITQVFGVVSVPRLIYKGDAQKEYRLLIGNPDVQAPSYDLASLRNVLLDYPARLVVLGSLMANPNFRPPSNYFQEGRMNLVLLGVLLLCVVVLLALSLRLLRNPHPEKAPPIDTDGQNPPPSPPAA